jgi:hypothetical protein
MEPGVGGIRAITVEPPTLDRAIVVEPWNRAVTVEPPTLDLTAMQNPGVGMIRLSHRLMVKPGRRRNSRGGDNLAALGKWW